jgi:Mg2+/Co2+ transporter CorC
MAVDDAEVLLNTELDSEATTIGGLVTAALGRLPVPGDTATVGDYEFEVERVADRAAESLLARPVVTEPRESE